MKKARIILGIFLMSIVLMTGCVQQIVSQSYTNSVYGFSFDPPLGWQQIENESPNVAAWFVPGNSSNVSLIIAVPFTRSEGRTLITYADQVEENLSESGVNYTILYRDWGSISQMQTYKLVYSYE